MPWSALGAALTADALDALDGTPTGHAWAEYLRTRRVQVVFSDALGGPGGTAWFGWRVYFPTSMRAYLEPDRLVHELVHTTQGPYLWGSLENERGAYIVQHRYLAEAAVEPTSRDFHMDIVTMLQRGGPQAYGWIQNLGPYYQHFAANHPKPWQVRAWLPQARYALSVAVSGGNRDVRRA